LNWRSSDRRRSIGYRIRLWVKYGQLRPYACPDCGEAIRLLEQRKEIYASLTRKYEQGTAMVLAADYTENMHEMEKHIQVRKALSKI
jgi:hypothetical protein